MQLPNISEVSAPRRVAGMVVPVLMQELKDQGALNLACPTQPPRSPFVPSLDQFPNMDRNEFEPSHD